MRIHVLQHESYEDSGYIALWASKNGHSITETHLYRKEVLPDLKDLDMLVIMGGPMNVNEEERFSWLAGEKAFIRSAIGAGKTVIGICLGAQLIASVLGARIYRNTNREIGWLPVSFSERALNSVSLGLFPLETTVFHWHGDTFDLPEGCVRLASSECTLNQAFQYGDRVFGFQFHLECTEENIKEFVTEGMDELQSGGRYVQKAEDILSNRVYTVNTNLLFKGFLDRVAGRCGQEKSEV